MNQHYHKPDMRQQKNKKSYNSFGARFSIALSSHGWLQADAAKECGISQPAIARYCSLETAPKQSTVEWLARRLKIPVSELLTEEELALLNSAGSVEQIENQEPWVRWGKQLRITWHQFPKRQLEISVFVGHLWPDQAPQIIRWLNDSQPGKKSGD